MISVKSWMRSLPESAGADTPRRDHRPLDADRLVRGIEERGVLVDSIRDALGDREELESKLGGIRSQSVIRCVDPADGSKSAYQDQFRERFSPTHIACSRKRELIDTGEGEVVERFKLR